MIAYLGGPMFEQTEAKLFKASECHACRQRKTGAHYNQYHITGGMESLKCIFPDGEADEMNFVLFSTSGVHGTYVTIEAIELSLQKYPDGIEGDDYPDDYVGSDLTVLIVQPRICCLRYGNVEVTLDDISYLKKLRQSSYDAVCAIGAGKGA